MAVKAQFDADFGKFVSELSRVEVKLRDFDGTADKSSAKLQRMADSLNGNKLLEQAAVAVNAIKRIEGGVAGLNNGELKRYGSLIDAATDKLIRQGREVPPALAQVKAALDQQRAAIEGTAKAAGDAQGLLGGIGGAIGQGLGIGAGIGAFDIVTRGVGAMKDAIVETIQEGNKLSQLRSAFESLQGGPAPATVALNDLRQATRGLVTDLDLMQAANKASLLGLGEMGIKTDELASVAVRLGKAMGQDAAKSVDDLTTALARQSPQILDNLGIKVSLTDANEKYAATLGKSVDALTDEEKKFAFATAAMDAARAKAETLGEQQLTLSEQITKVGNTLDNAQASMGAAVNESGLLSGAVGLLGESLDELLDSAGQVKTELVDVFGPAGQVASSLLAIASNSEQAGDGLKLALLPGLTLVNAALKGTAAQLDRVAALRELVAGTLDDVQLPSIARDRQLIDPTFGQGKRAQDVLAAEQKRLTDEYVKAQDEALKKLEQGTQKGNAKLDQLAKERTERLNRLTGRDALIAAQQTVKDLSAVGVASLSPAQTSKVFSQLFDAREIARTVQPSLVSGLTSALQAVAQSPIIRAEAADAGAKFLKGIATGLSNAKASDFGGSFKIGALDSLIINSLGKGGKVQAAITGVLGKTLGADITFVKNELGDLIPQNLLADTYALRKGLDGVGIPLDVINDRFDKVTKKTGDWQTSLRNVTQAFANLSQISGGALDGVTTSLGTVLGAADAAVSAVQSLGDLFKNEKFASSNAGKALSGGLAGLAAGPAVARLAGVNTQSGAFLAGGVGGAAAGFAAGGPVGAGVGFAVGGISALLAQRAQEKALREEMARNRESLLANFESREDLIRQAQRVGLSETYIRSRILDNTNDAKAYTDAVNKLNAAFATENRQATALSKSLGEVAKVNGVLSVQQTRDLRDALVVTPPLSPTPDARRGPGTGGGIATPRDGTPSPIGDRRIAEDGPKKEAAEAFLRQQGESLLAGLGRILEQPGALTPSLVKAVGQSLPGALAELQRQGLSSIDALKTLQPLLEQFQQKAVLAGAGSTPGFDALNEQLRILKDERLGPLIERANGSGQALGALQNLGLLTQETFSGFATSIADTVAGMDLLSTDGQNAMRLIQQPLQNVWQLQKDFGFEVDEATKKLLDQAEASGLIGDKFRPAEERIAEGITSIVERLDQLIDGFTNGFPKAAIDGAGKAAKGIEETFGKVKPLVTVDYDTRERHPLGDDLRDDIHKGGTDGADLAAGALEDRLSDPSLWHGLRDGLETDATIGAGLAAAAVEETFARVRIRVPIHYEPIGDDPRVTFPEDPRRNEGRVTLPWPSGPEQAGAGSTAGFDAAKAATASTKQVGVFIDGRLAGEAILPHAGSILEFNGITRVNA